VNIVKDANSRYGEILPVPLPARGVSSQELYMHTSARLIPYVAITILSLALSVTGQIAPAAIPIPEHVILVMEENHGYSQIIASSNAPYINTLASVGASFTNSHAITHPSQPNYLELFSGSNQGVTDDSCPHTFSVPSLESELIAATKTFRGYSEGLPAVGATVCASGLYARKHVPWTDFSKDLTSDNLPFTSFPTNYSKLPTVAWVIPNLDDDMHNGTIRQGDTWLQAHLLDYVNWAMKNNSLLIVTFDEDQGTTTNHIATIFVGPMVKPGKYSEKINHYNVLRTIEDMYGLSHLGNSSNATPITDVWQ
jgi:phosphatidylinositol-3-phosphatase